MTQIQENIAKDTSWAVVSELLDKFGCEYMASNIFILKETLKNFAVAESIKLRMT